MKILGAGENLGFGRKFGVRVKILSFGENFGVFGYMGSEYMSSNSTWTQKQKKQDI